MTQILTHTPAYVWAILAFLLWRGVVEMRTREIAARRMLVLPLAMLALSLHDMATRFGAGAAMVAVWVAGVTVAGLLAWRFGRVRVTPGSMPDRVLVRGSRLPLLVMMAIFAVKYATGVALALQPQLAQQTAIVLAVSLVHGLFNGLFLVRLARDMAAWRGASAGLAGQAG